MSDLKTQRNKASVRDFLNAIEDADKRRDCKLLAKEMKRLSGWKAVLWGASIVGFGSYHYRYKSGREGDWMVTGFSPRKQNISIYIMPGFEPFSELMTNLGKFKTGRSCLYVRQLDDIDTQVLWRLVSRSIEWMQERYPCVG